MAPRTLRSLGRMLAVLVLLGAAVSAVAAVAQQDAGANGGAPQTEAAAVSAREDLAADGVPSRAPARARREKSEHEKRIELIGVSIGFAATVLGIGIGMLAIWCDYRKGAVLVEACHKERLAALERGLEVPPFPPELLGADAVRNARVPSTGLKPGLMWVAMGIGLWLFLSARNTGLFHPSVSAIPAAIGVAYLVYFAVEGRKRSPSPPTEPPGF